MGEITKTLHVDERPKPRYEYCNRCLSETNHDVLYSRTTKWEEAVDDDHVISIAGANTHALVQCRGCDTIRMVHQHWFSEDYDEKGPIQHKDYYPPNVNRAKPEWVAFGLPLKDYEIADILSEIYTALGVNALRLSAMGIRALVERMMIDKVGDQGTFEKNVRAFFEAGYVAGFQQDIFNNTLIEAGHAAMHRNWEPSGEDINTLLDIVEALIKAIYVDPVKAEKVGKRIPVRAPMIKKAAIEAPPLAADAQTG